MTTVGQSFCDFFCATPEGAIQCDSTNLKADLARCNEQLKNNNDCVEEIHDSVAIPSTFDWQAHAEELGVNLTARKVEAEALKMRYELDLNTCSENLMNARDHATNSTNLAVDVAIALESSMSKAEELREQLDDAKVELKASYNDRVLKFISLSMCMVGIGGMFVVQYMHEDVPHDKLSVTARFALPTTTFIIGGIVGSGIMYMV